MDNALGSLALAAALLGNGAPSTAPPPPAVPKAVKTAGQPQEVLRLSLADVDRDQARAVDWQAAGRGSVGLSVGFDPKADLWVKFRQKGHVSAHPLAALRAGVEEFFPDDNYRLSVDNGMARAVPLAPPHSPQASASLPSLIRALYDAALHVRYQIVEYAVVREDGASIPASICLIRQDASGRFWVTYRKPEELKTINWLASVNGTLFGMRLEGNDLAFYTKPTPQIP